MALHYVKQVRRCLLETVRGLLERTYRMETGIGQLGSFVIGDEGFRRLYGAERLYRSVDSADGAGAKVLVRQTEAGVSACIYFPDAMIRRLESHPPQRGLSRANFTAFAAFVEEVDHLLLLAERNRLQRPLTLLEMELHANVSKYFVLSRFLAGRGRPLETAKRIWLRRHLFDETQHRHDDPVLRERYRRAALWAVRLIGGLSDKPPPQRLEILRRFHAAGPRDKLELIARLN